MVTLDLDFANPFSYPPKEYSGIIVLRFGTTIEYHDLKDSIETVIQGLKSMEVINNLWVVKPGRIRIFEDI